MRAGANAALKAVCPVIVHLGLLDRRDSGRRGGSAAGSTPRNDGGVGRSTLYGRRGQRPSTKTRTRPAISEDKRPLYSLSGAAKRNAGKNVSKQGKGSDRPWERRSSVNSGPRDGFPLRRLQRHRPRTGARGRGAWCWSRRSRTSTAHNHPAERGADGFRGGADGLRKDGCPKL